MTHAADSPADDTPRRTPKASWAGRPAEPTHLEGRVDRGSRGGCLHLESAGVVYELIGATTELAVGRQVAVTGHVDRTVTSPCGRGVPFVVTGGSPEPTHDG